MGLAVRWGARQQGNGGQIYGQYAPPNGPLVIECQMPSMSVPLRRCLWRTSLGSGPPWHAPDVANTQGYGRVWTRYDATNTWQPTTIWKSPTVHWIRVRSLAAYTDSVTGMTYLFAGV